ncbi:MAG: hypothetical protein QXJ53_01535 [Candidatus Bathyarchaeia archaeon]
MIYIIIGLLDWVFKEVRSENPTHYWLWFSSGPYIRSAEGRVEHIAFKSKVLLTCGIPTFLIGIFSPDALFEITNVIGIGVLVLLAWILHLIFVADAAERDKYAAEGISQEEIEKVKERD